MSDRPPKPGRVPKFSEVAPEPTRNARTFQAENTLASVTEPVPPMSPGPGVGVVLGGRYRLDEALASGGMGKVFRAQHLDLKVPVAVKILHGFMAGSEEAGRRFYREARAASMLSHPNVVKVTDYGTHDGQPYLVMELVMGESMAYWLDTHTTPPALSEVREAMLQVSRAVEAAHASGIVHRDLKPDNVMQGTLPDGKVLWKVADFGLAHLDDPKDFGSTLTQADAVAGTPDYMSPEQCRSLKVGPSTDIYALGCILTELLQLSPPFAGASAIDVISQHMFTPPPALKRPNDAEPIPDLLERLRLQLLAKRPHERPSSIAAVIAALEKAFDPAENERALPDRKGEQPLGARDQRHPEWVQSAGTPTSDSTATIVVERVGSGNAEGVTSEVITAMRARGFAVVDAGSDLEADIRVFDAETNTAAGLSALEHAQTPVVICAAGLSAPDVNRFIEAGAADVVRYPVRGEQLARKLSRIARTLRKL